MARSQAGIPEVGANTLDSMVTGKTRTDACDAASHVQPVGPPLLAVLEFALGALEPAGLSAQDRLEGFAIINGAVLNFVRTELASQAANPAAQAGQFARLPELLATGRYPRFAAVMAQGGQPETIDLGAYFDRLLDKLLDGLVP